jgi:hypothetical protein
VKEVTILVWCDSCAAAGKREPATGTQTAAVGAGGQPAALDLCDACEADLLAPLAALLADYGAPVDQPATISRPTPVPTSSRGGGYSCPICGATRNARSALADHVWRDHLAQPRPPVPTTCPDCGYTAVNSKNPSASVGRHRSNSHGYDPLAEALTRYTETAEGPESKPA